MPTSGSGTMTAIPVLSGWTSPAGDNREWRTRDSTALPVRLTRYAEVMGIPSLLFWGVSRGSTVPNRELFFSGEDRRRILQALIRATSMMESQLRVHLVPKWRTETHTFQGLNPVNLERQLFLESGVRGFTVYDHSVPVSYYGDYASITVAHNGNGTWEEIRVFYCDSAYDKGPEPVAVQVGETNVVLTFTRESLVKPSVQMTGTYKQNHEFQPVAWSDISNFCAALTVAREYTDDSDQATLRYQQTCNGRCTWSTQTGCVRDEDADLGWVNVHPGVYSSGTWCRRNYTRMPEQVIVNYCSGLQEQLAGFEDALYRLAHTVMPGGPCASTVAPWYEAWQRDRNQEQSFSRERLNCPWGTMDGAWFAWNYLMNSEYNTSRGGGWLGRPKRRAKWQSHRQLW